MKTSHYDSNGPYGDPSYEVIDAYKDEETAEKVAQLVLASKKYGIKEIPEIPLANGTDKIGGKKGYLSWLSWGESFENVGIYEFTLKKNVVRRVYSY